ncbi:hypothetical protein LCGC14_2348330, partial [marine sediment metagenome]
LHVDPPRSWLDCQADPNSVCSIFHQNDLLMLGGNAVVLVIVVFVSIRTWRWSQGYRWWPQKVGDNET